MISKLAALLLAACWAFGRQLPRWPSASSGRGLCLGREAAWRPKLQKQDRRRRTVPGHDDCWLLLPAELLRAGRAGRAGSAMHRVALAALSLAAAAAGGRRDVMIWTDCARETM
eukprot:COSAG06_NODE_21603_length_751_cov_1.211656_1_plen_114_part_00